MVSIEWQDGVALVRLGAEQNMVNGDFVDGINRALDEVEANPDAKALVTAGEGKFYSYGFDLEYIQSLGADGDAFLNRSRTLMARMMTFGFPTVAALNGHAFGAGGCSRSCTISESPGEIGVGSAFPRSISGSGSTRSCSPSREPGSATRSHSKH